MKMLDLGMMYITFDASSIKQAKIRIEIIGKGID